MSSRSNQMGFLSITGARSEDEIKAYLYSHSELLDSGVTPAGRVWAVVEVPDGHAQYQADRISSGMMGVRIHATDYQAALSIIDRL